jgi:hypothetical protein
VEGVAGTVLIDLHGLTDDQTALFTSNPLAVSAALQANSRRQVWSCLFRVAESTDPEQVVRIVQAWAARNGIPFRGRRPDPAPKSDDSP